jgi:hypothetical protein
MRTAMNRIRSIVYTLAPLAMAALALIAARRW